MTSNIPILKRSACIQLPDAPPDSAEGRVSSLPEDVDHRLEGKPLGDLLPGAQTAAELSAGELHDLLALLLGLALLDVAFLGADVDHVLVVCHSHTELRGVLLPSLLRIVGAIEVVACDGALGAGHVTPDDEVCGAEVLPDDHVLDCLPRACHFHAVGEVGPTEHRELLLGLLTKSLVRANPDDPVDVTGLSRAARGMHEQDGVGDIALSALQELKVGPVDGIPILESDDSLALRQRRTHISGRHHLVLELRASKTVHAAAQVVLTLLGNERVHGGMLQARGAESFLGLHDLVGLKDRGRLKHRDVLARPAQQHLVPLLQALDALDVKGHRETEELLLWEAHALHHGVVSGLCHEAVEGAEGAMQEAEDIACLALAQFDGAHRGTLESRSLGRVLHHEVHQRATVWGARGRRPRVDATLSLRLAHEAAGPFALVGLHRHSGVHIAE
mmetsp:Transcript_100318/g.224045  ORF Transcript_100318/g.224045 Transcript_100318/m.224045 type:complete len:446 (-) Transcript_100318:868-2205(-)